MMALDWIAFVFSLGATLFWTVSICCCSGKSSHSRRGNRDGEKGFGQPRGYQPVGEGAPFGHQGQNEHGNVEMGNMGAGPYKGRENSYEPFRHT